MIERLTGEMIDEAVLKLCGIKGYLYFLQGVDFVRQHYEKELQKLKDLFYITPIDWIKTCEGYHSGDYIIKKYSQGYLVFYKRQSIKINYFLPSVIKAKKYAESHRIEQMIAQGLRRVEL